MRSVYRNHKYNCWIRIHYGRPGTVSTRKLHIYISFIKDELLMRTPFNQVSQGAIRRAHLSDKFDLRFETETADSGQVQGGPDEVAPFQFPNGNRFQ